MIFTQSLYELFKDELIQLKEEGCLVENLNQEFLKLNPNDPKINKQIEKLYKKVSRLKPSKDFPFNEPSDLEKIKKKRIRGVLHTVSNRRIKKTLSDAELKNRIYGAWLGRCAGCMLGKPLEPLGYNPTMMLDILKAHNAYPITDYIPWFDTGLPSHIALNWWNELKPCTRGNIRCSVRDDDTDYTILGLYYLEKFGAEFSSKNVAETWLSRLPYHQVYTAERVAYFNLVNNLEPPLSARFRNPFREWIGAQIRADGFGYVTPGWPEKAAEFAYRDASVSHVKNGIYGEMLMSAIISAALVSQSSEEAIDTGISEIPKTSRLFDAVQKVRTWVKEDNNPEKIIERIHAEYGKYHCVHTINNAALVIMALCYSDLDYEKGITLAVTGGYDTDCNGATVGSIIGAIVGADALPKKWIEPLNDTLESSVIGYHVNKISELAERTLQQAKMLIS